MLRSNYDRDFKINRGAFLYSTVLHYRRMYVGRYALYCTVCTVQVRIRREGNNDILPMLREPRAERDAWRALLPILLYLCGLLCYAMLPTALHNIGLHLVS